MEIVIEWTFEGSLKSMIIHLRVWLVGNRTRYQSGVYVSTLEEWTIRQYEWYRDNYYDNYRLRYIIIYLRLFYYLKCSMRKRIGNLS